METSVQNNSAYKVTTKIPNKRRLIVPEIGIICYKIGFFRKYLNFENEFVIVVDNIFTLRIIRCKKPIISMFNAKICKFFNAFVQGDVSCDGQFVPVAEISFMQHINNCYSFGYKES